jgi:hypothetical protein
MNVGCGKNVPHALEMEEKHLNISVHQQLKIPCPETPAISRCAVGQPVPPILVSFLSVVL